MARANTEHAQTLLQQHKQIPLSTREFERIYAHYQKVPKAERERLVQNPGLFLKAQQTAKQAIQDKDLAAGPEGHWHGFPEKFCSSQ